MALVVEPQLPERVLNVTCAEFRVQPSVVMPSSYLKLFRRQASPLALLLASCWSVVEPPSEAGFDVQLVFLPAAFQPQIAPSVTCATGHCFVQTVHSAGFLQPGSQPIGRSSSGTGQQVLGVAAESSSMLALHQT